MAYVLLVDDSPVILKILRHLSGRIENYEAILAASLTEARKIVENQGDNPCFAAVVDLNLPDAPDGEIVDVFLQKKIPTIVLTGTFNEQVQADLIKKGVVDYVLKESRYSYEYAIDLVNRLHQNQQTQVLIAEDSATTRGYIRKLLETRLYQVFEAEDGQQALTQLKQHPDIKLIISDYQMPNMDGFELVQTLRHKMERKDLIVLGLSSTEDTGTSTRFIKNGANDFLSKPFNSEEFHCRIDRNMDSLHMLERMKNMAYEDFLTGMPNRRWLAEKGTHALALTKHHNRPFTAVILDLDNFKSVNDSYGHEAGDQVLAFFGQEMKEFFSKALVGRTGGEEFSILFPGSDTDHAYDQTSLFKQQIAVQPILMADGEELFISFSAGISSEPADTLDDYLRNADLRLMEAKQAGKNLIVCED